MGLFVGLSLEGFIFDVPFHRSTRAEAPWGKSPGRAREDSQDALPLPGERSKDRGTSNATARVGGTGARWSGRSPCAVCVRLLFRSGGVMIRGGLICDGSRKGGDDVNEASPVG